jgi:type II restriction enzyme
LAINTPAVDYTCPDCCARFQLKARSSAFAGRIVDAPYSTMVRAIREDRTPNLFALHYEPEEWRVANLILIPHFAFPLSAVEKRKPLGPDARRAGWVGCNILLSAIPLDARIPLIAGAKPAAPATFERNMLEFGRLKSCERNSAGGRSAFLNVVHSLGKTEFDLGEV